MAASQVELVGSVVPGTTAAADLSAKQFLFVKQTSTALAVDVCGAGELMLGVLQNKPASGQAATVWGVGSTSKVIAGEQVDPGDKVSSDGSGKARTAQDNDWMAGICVVGAAADGEYCSVYLCPVSLGIDDDT